MGILVWLIIGGVVGWLASIVMRRDGSQGIILNIVVGIVGSVLGAWLIGPIVGAPSINSTPFMSQKASCGAAAWLQTRSARLSWLKSPVPTTFQPRSASPGGLVARPPDNTRSFMNHTTRSPVAAWRHNKSVVRFESKLRPASGSTMVAVASA